MKRGPYEVTSSEIKYQNPWITVHEDKFTREDGTKGLYGVIEYGAGVATVALTKDKEIILVKEYAYAIDEYNISFPSGGIDEGEDPLTAAKRELQEESGVGAETWTSLGYINPFTMVVNSPVHLFLAENATIQTEHEKEFEVMIVPFEEAYHMVMDSKINHAGSVVAILKAHEVLSNRQI